MKIYVPLIIKDYKASLLDAVPEKKLDFHAYSGYNIYRNVFGRGKEKG